MNVTDLFFSMFLHGGFMHLAGNMLFLFTYGNNVEDRLGPFGFLVAYLATGVAAAMFQAAFNMTSNIPMVDASGAFSGVHGFYLRWFPRHYVKVFMFLPPFFMGVRMFSASLVLWMYLILDNVVPFLLASQGDGGVAHGAHIGGFIAGLAAAFVLGRPEPGPAEVPPDRAGSAALESQSKFAEAASEYQALAAKIEGPAALRAKLDAARALREAGSIDEARGLLEPLTKEPVTAQEAKPQLAILENLAAAGR